MIASNLSVNFTGLIAPMFKEDKRPQSIFDARVFPTNIELVSLMFTSRIRSCNRNTVSEFHDYFFGTTSSKGLKGLQKKQHMMDVYNYNFDELCPPCLKFGVFIKGDKIIVPLELPKLSLEFINFLYAKKIKDENIPFKFIFFEDMLKLYLNGEYLPQEIRSRKEKEYELRREETKKINEIKLTKSLEFIRPSEEEVVRLRLQRKIDKKEKLNNK
jgi:hypothetical protein